jgi:hypothetical protein
MDQYPRRNDRIDDKDRRTSRPLYGSVRTFPNKASREILICIKQRAAMRYRPPSATPHVIAMAARPRLTGPPRRAIFAASMWERPGAPGTEGATAPETLR